MGLGPKEWVYARRSMKDHLCLAMRTLTPIAFVLLTAAALPGAVKAGDAEGCVDLKLFPRLEGCVIQECSAKQHDSFDTSEGSAGPLDANVNALTYSCPASMDLPRL